MLLVCGKRVLRYNPWLQGLLFCLSTSIPIVAQETSSSAAPPSFGKVAAAWKKAGAVLRSMYYSSLGSKIVIHPYILPASSISTPDSIFSEGDLLVFSFYNCSPEVLRNLPAPSFPFGLSIANSQDAHLKACVRFDHLQELHLGTDRDEYIVTGEGLSWLARLPRLRGLALPRQPITDLDLQPLFSLQSLRSLDLSGTEVEGSNFHFARWPHLETLTISQTPFGDKGMHQLVSHSHLRWLALSDTKITSKGLIFLSRLPHLRVLYLDGVSITDNDLQHLQHLRELRYLFLRRTAITGAGLRYLRALPQLEVLNLGSTSLTDAGFSCLPRLPQLRWLAIDNTQITDTGLRVLRCLPNLEGVDLAFCPHVTVAGIRNLQQACPRLLIITNDIHPRVYRPSSP
jgi:hypothetical protein